MRKNALFPGINAAARALGVSRITLYRVLKRQHPDNKNLIAGYAQWRRQQRTARLSP